ncbi:MAG: RNA polymerase sigma factor [Candidatus Omnitrophica bacterium]|nr:RNA polymerase sigma factor [Candidatus Omnitrophota bacterium]
MPAEEDWILIQKFRDGDPSGFQEIFNRHRSRVINLSFRFLQNREAAEDVAQEVFIKIYEKKLVFNPKAKFTTWLYRVTVNASLDRTKRKSFFDRSLDKVETGDGGEDKTLLETLSDRSAVSPAAALEQKELSGLVQAALRKLPEKLRVPILLHRFDGLPYGEIAQILGTSVKAVERRIYHAKEALRASLAEFQV